MGLGRSGCGGGTRSPMENMENNRNNSGPQPALREWEPGQAKPLPVAFPCGSFDLFLRQTAETQGTESWCLAVAGDGARGSAGLLHTKVLGRM